MTEHPGYVWDVYPRISSLPMVAQGHSGDETGARLAVEFTLATDDASAWGLIAGPDGITEVCQRTANGGFHWRPLPVRT